MSGPRGGGYSIAEKLRVERQNLFLVDYLTKLMTRKSQYAVPTEAMLYPATALRSTAAAPLQSPRSARTRSHSHSPSRSKSRSPDARRAARKGNNSAVQHDAGDGGEEEEDEEEEMSQDDDSQAQSRSISASAPTASAAAFPPPRLLGSYLQRRRTQAGIARSNALLGLRLARARPAVDTYHRAGRVTAQLERRAQAARQERVAAARGRGALRAREARLMAPMEGRLALLDANEAHQNAPDADATAEENNRSAARGGDAARKKHRVGRGAGVRRGGVGTTYRDARGVRVYRAVPKKFESLTPRVDSGVVRASLHASADEILNAHSSGADNGAGGHGAGFAAARPGASGLAASVSPTSTTAAPAEGNADNASSRAVPGMMRPLHMQRNNDNNSNSSGSSTTDDTGPGANPEADEDLNDILRSQPLHGSPAATAAANATAAAIANAAMAAAAATGAATSSLAETLPSPENVPNTARGRKSYGNDATKSDAAKSRTFRPRPPTVYFATPPMPPPLPGQPTAIAGSRVSDNGKEAAGGQNATRTDRGARPRSAVLSSLSKGVDGNLSSPASASASAARDAYGARVERMSTVYNKETQAFRQHRRQTDATIARNKAVYSNTALADADDHPNDTASTQGVATDVAAAEDGESVAPAAPLLGPDLAPLTPDDAPGYETNNVISKRGSTANARDAGEDESLYYAVAQPYSARFHSPHFPAARFVTGEPPLTATREPEAGAARAQLASARSAAEAAALARSRAAAVAIAQGVALGRVLTGARGRLTAQDRARAAAALARADAHSGVGADGNKAHAGEHANAVQRRSRRPASAAPAGRGVSASESQHAQQLGTPFSAASLSRELATARLLRAEAEDFALYRAAAEAAERRGTGSGTYMTNRTETAGSGAGGAGRGGSVWEPEPVPDKVVVRVGRDAAGRLLRPASAPPSRRDGSATHTNAAPYSQTTAAGGVVRAAVAAKPPSSLRGPHWPAPAPPRAALSSTASLALPRRPTVADSAACGGCGKCGDCAAATWADPAAEPTQLPPQARERVRRLWAAARAEAATVLAKMPPVGADLQRRADVPPEVRPPTTRAVNKAALTTTAVAGAITAYSGNNSARRPASAHSARYHNHASGDDGGDSFPERPLVTEALPTRPLLRTSVSPRARMLPSFYAAPAERAAALEPAARPRAVAAAESAVGAWAQRRAATRGEEFSIHTGAKRAVERRILEHRAERAAQAAAAEADEAAARAKARENAAKSDDRARRRRMMLAGAVSSNGNRHTSNAHNDGDVRALCCGDDAGTGGAPGVGCDTAPIGELRSEALIRQAQAATEAAAAARRRAATPPASAVRGAASAAGRAETAAGLRMVSSLSQAHLISRGAGPAYQRNSDNASAYATPHGNVGGGARSGCGTDMSARQDTARQGGMQASMSAHTLYHAHSQAQSQAQWAQSLRAQAAAAVAGAGAVAEAARAAAEAEAAAQQDHMLPVSVSKRHLLSRGPTPG